MSVPWLNGPEIFFPAVKSRPSGESKNIDRNTEPSKLTRFKLLFFYSDLTNLFKQLEGWKGWAVPGRGAGGG